MNPDLQDLRRLRFSRHEADEIARLAPNDAKLEAVDFEANRNLATSAELGQYRIVHFATHGLINNQHPELSGIVLSLVDEKGQPQNGFLRLYDLYNLKLSADLVVLSACQTALGKEIKGEGLVGLTRGFMYAGAPRVIASLWQIDDRASAEFMKRFYQGCWCRNYAPPPPSAPHKSRCKKTNAGTILTTGPPSPFRVNGDRATIGHRNTTHCSCSFNVSGT